MLFILRALDFSFCSFKILLSQFCRKALILKMFTQAYHVINVHVSRVIRWGVWTFINFVLTWKLLFTKSHRVVFFTSWPSISINSLFLWSWHYLNRLFFLTLANTFLLFKIKGNLFDFFFKLDDLINFILKSSLQSIVLFISRSGLKSPMFLHFFNFCLILFNFAFKFVNFFLFIFKLINDWIRMKFHLLFDFNMISNIRLIFLYHFLIIFGRVRSISLHWNWVGCNRPAQPSLFSWIWKFMIRPRLPDLLPSLDFAFLKLLTGQIFLNFYVHENFNRSLNVIYKINRWCLIKILLFFLKFTSSKISNLLFKVTYFFFCAYFHIQVKFNKSLLDYLNRINHVFLCIWLLIACSKLRKFFF